MNEREVEWVECRFCEGSGDVYVENGEIDFADGIEPLELCPVCLGEGGFFVDAITRHIVRLES